MTFSHAVPNTVEPVLFEEIRRLLQERGFRCSGRKYVLRGWMAHDQNTYIECRIIRKNYAVEWNYEIHFSINWLNIFKLYSLSEGDFDVNHWKKYAVVATGTPRLQANKKWGRDLFKFTRTDEVDRLFANVSGVIEEIGFPFFEQWHAYLDVKEEFYAHTDAARSVTLTPSTLSVVAISIAALHDRNRVEQIIRKHREYVGGFEGRGTERIENFVSELRTRGLI